jgi:nitrate reductase delta subunit
MSRTLRALSALLSYPSAELKQHIGEVRTVLRAEAVLPAALQQRLEPLLRSFESEDLLDLQAAYCELFDQSRSLSLHLFEHVHGDSRERGQAMIDLGQR